MGLRLTGEVSLDGSGFERGLHHLGEKGKEFSADFVKNAAITAFGFYGVEEAIKKTVETASELVNTSKRLDVTVEQLQVLRQAAKESGTELSSIASAFEKIDIARTKALAGDKEALAAFAKLGVTSAQLKTQTASELFTGSISSAAKNNSVEDIGPALKEVLGKGFGELLPTLKTDFEELEGKMKSLGTIMDTDTAVKLHALEDNFDLLKNILVTGLAPVLVTVIEALLDVVGKVKSFGAYLGALTSQGIGKGIATVINDNPAIGAFFPGAGLLASLFDKKDLEGVSADAGQAALDANKAWQDMLDKLKSALAKEADDLKHPKPRSGEVEPTPAATQKTRALGSINGDALIKSGNFLGSNGNTIERVNQQKLAHLKSISDSSKKTSESIKKMADQISAVASFGLGGIPLN